MCIKRRYLIIIFIGLTLLVSSTICINGSTLITSKSNEGTNLMKINPITWWNSLNLWKSFSGESISSIGTSRTFGHIRRMQMVLIPIVFKIGVMSAMISVLVFLALKTVLLLKALLVINAGSILAKILSAKSPMFHGWNPYSEWSHHSNWPSPHSQGKEIHVHIHNGPKSESSHDYKHWHTEPYGAYSSNTNQYAKSSQENGPGPGPGPGPDRYGNFIYHNH